MKKKGYSDWGSEEVFHEVKRILLGADIDERVGFRNKDKDIKIVILKTKDQYILKDEDHISKYRHKDIEDVIRKGLDVLGNGWDNIGKEETK